jgi:hypothetical protein
VECFEEFRGEVQTIGGFFDESFSDAAFEEVFIELAGLVVHGFSFCFWFFGVVFHFRYLSHILLLFINSMIFVANDGI